MKQYTCACCGKRLKPDQWIYSRWTRNRYCWEVVPCLERARKKRRSTRRLQNEAVRQA